MRALVFFAAAIAGFAQQPGDLRQLVRDSLRFIDGDRRNEFDYSWRSERKQFDSSGKVTSHTTLIGEKVTVDGVNIHRLIERDGKKLTDEQVKGQEAKIREFIAKIKSETPRPGKKGSDDEWVKEIADALDFKLVGEEAVDGRPAWVLTCSPRPGYSAKNMRARVFEKMNGRIWIDKAERELVRGEAETFDTVKMGFGILGRVEKGTRFHIARTRLPSGVWLLESQSIRFGARMLLVKWMGNEIHTRHWNYQKKQS